MEVASLPRRPFFTPCRKELRIPQRKSLRLCWLYRGVSLRCVSRDSAILRNSNHSSQGSWFCIARKHVTIPGLHHNLKKNLYGANCNFEVLCKNNFFRQVAVRSQLAEVGSPGDEYPSTEVKLNSRIRGMCFYAITTFVALFLFVLMLIGHPFVMLMDPYRRNFHHLIAKMWALLTVTLFFNIKFEGLENLPPPNSPAVYVSNHQSFVDIYTLLTLGRNFKFISKTGIFVFPVVGWAMLLMGIIPLKRMDSQSQLECLRRCIDLVNKGGSVFFFPEGTRSKDGKLGKFKKGAFSIAAKTSVPVVPITLMGTGQIMPAGREGILNSGSVRVVIHKPIEGSNADMICEEARNKISSVLPA